MLVMHICIRICKTCVRKEKCASICLLYKLVLICVSALIGCLLIHTILRLSKSQAAIQCLERASYVTYVNDINRLV